MSAFESLKSVANVLRQADKIEEYSTILDVQNQLLEMQARIQKLTKENEGLREKLSFQGKLEYDNRGLYWSSDDEERKNPFCSACWDDKKKTIRMQEYRKGDYKCPACKNFAASNRDDSSVTL